MPGADTLRSLAAPPMVPVTMTARTTSTWRNVIICESFPRPGLAFEPADDLTGSSHQHHPPVSDIYLKNPDDWQDAIRAGSDREVIETKSKVFYDGSNNVAGARKAGCAVSHRQ